MANVFDRLDEFPPVLCRLLAVKYPLDEKRRWPVALCEAEICHLSGLSAGTVRYISLLTDWDAVPVGNARLFIKGCRLNLFNFRALDRARDMVQRGTFAHATRAPHWESQLREIYQTWENAKHGYSGKT